MDKGKREMTVFFREIKPEAMGKDNGGVERYIRVRGAIRKAK